MENNDIRTIEEAFRRAERLNWSASASENSEKDEAFLSAVEHLETGIEGLHRVSRMDKEAGAARLAARLTALSRKKKMVKIWLRVAVAATIVVSVGIMLWLHLATRQDEKTLVVVNTIQVPTLIYEENQKVVAVEELDLQVDRRLYMAREKQPKIASNKPVKSEQEIIYQKIVIPAGYIYSVLLADGSVVTLNAGSELRFPNHFNDTVRTVELKGEAYFAVEKSDIPFVVKGGDTQVKVYGTEFNFLYSEELRIAEAVLVSGSIGMRLDGQELKIAPNQRVYRHDSTTLAFEEVNPADYTAWMGDSFKYNSTRLDRIVNDIARWYGIKIVLAPELREQTYTLEFDKSATVDWTLQALGRIVERNIIEKGGTYNIE